MAVDGSTRGHVMKPLDAHPRDWNVDGALDARPGVPTEWTPHLFPGAPAEPEAQRHGREALAGLGVTPTPVFGTAHPPRRLSGLIRRAAYRIPDHETSRWLLLMAADRMDVTEHRIARALAWVPPIGALGGAIFLAARFRRGLA